MSTVPHDGQEWCGMFSLTTRGGSLGMEVYWSILSTDMILVSKLLSSHIIHACMMFRLRPYVTAKPATPSKTTNMEWRNQVLLPYFIISMFILLQNRTRLDKILDG